MFDPLAKLTLDVATEVAYKTSLILFERVSLAKRLRDANNLVDLLERRTKPIESSLVWTQPERKAVAQLLQEIETHEAVPFIQLPDEVVTKYMQEMRYNLINRRSKDRLLDYARASKSLDDMRIKYAFKNI